MTSVGIQPSLLFRIYVDQIHENEIVFYLYRCNIIIKRHDFHKKKIITNKNK